MKKISLIAMIIFLMGLPIYAQASKTGESGCATASSNNAQIRMAEALGFKASTGNSVARIVCTELKWYSFTLDQRVSRNTILLRADIASDDLQFAHALMFLYSGKTDVSDDMTISVQAETDADINGAGLIAGAVVGNCATAGGYLDDRTAFLKKTNYYGQSTQTMIDALNRRRPEAEQFCRRLLDVSGPVTNPPAPPAPKGCDNIGCTYDFIQAVIQRRCMGNAPANFCWLLRDTASRLAREMNTQ